MIGASEVHRGGSASLAWAKCSGIAAPVVLPLVEGLQDAVRAGAIAASGLGPVTPCEHDRERIAVDPSVLVEHLADAEGHGRIVGPAPRARRQGALLDEAMDRRGRHEEALTKGVADAQAFQGAESPREQSEQAVAISADCP